MSLEEAFTRARAERKCVLVDVYTDWCSWCKKMDRETYTNTQVRAMLEKEFLVVKLNAESDAELTFNGSRMTMVEFAQQAGVTGYPTTLFFDSNGRKVVSLPGYMDAPRFARVLDYVSAARYRTTPLDEYLAREI